VIAGIAFATLVPSFLVSTLIDERETRQASVQAEFTRNWGPEQVLGGPVLVLPFRSAATPVTRYLKIAPTRLTLNTALAPEERRRGLFRATVYDAAIDMKAAFVVPDEARLRSAVNDKEPEFLWSEAYVAARATSLIGTTAEDGVSVNGTRTRWTTCREMARAERDCPAWDMVAAKIGLTARPDVAVSIEGALHLRGTGSFTLQSAAREVDATIQAPWAHPSFVGDVLATVSDVSGDRFQARWQVVDQSAVRTWSGSELDLDPKYQGTRTGVDLIEGMPTYRMITRTAKYSLLLVVLSFATYFFFELLSGLRIHPIQYGLVGLSMTLFTLLLLPLAEMMGYTGGFVVSALLVLLQASIYTAAVARRAAPALIFAAMLAGVFGFLYVLLSLESYSLLVGALALFVVLSAMMALTQLVRWDGAEAPTASPSVPDSRAA
jgi:inner membrane protein